LCGCGVNEPILKTTNPDIVQLPIDYNNGIETGRSFFSIWCGDRIYSTTPLRYYELGSNLNLLKDSVLFAYTLVNSWPPVPDSVLKNYFGLRCSPDGSSLLAVKSTVFKVSNGSLDEISTNTWRVEQLLDSTNNISSATYISSDSIIYYTNGKSIGGNDAGYYLFEKTTHQSTLLMQYYTTQGVMEPHNGFDFSRNRRTMIIPLTTQGDPKVVEFNIDTHHLDTISANIGSGIRRWCLYLRYNHDGSKFLYSSYPRQAIQGPCFEGSELGIIDFATETKEILSLEIEKGAETLCLFPDWSPYESHIVFGGSSIAIEPAGTISHYQATIARLSH
jgi:hypothetical protein